MVRKWILNIFAMFLAAPFLSAGYGHGDARMEKLFGTFISPCCWRENLTVHDSPVAEELRGRIAAMVQEGRSDQEIKSVLVGEFGKRILSLPEGSQRAWLFATPGAVLAAGLAALVLLLKKLRCRQALPVLAGITPIEVDDHWDEP
jgi:cytochrome c-type biogenesis protein CcmH/NrfF